MRKRRIRTENVNPLVIYLFYFIIRYVGYVALSFYALVFASFILAIMSNFDITFSNEIINYFFPQMQGQRALDINMWNFMELFFGAVLVLTFLFDFALYIIKTLGKTNLGSSQDYNFGILFYKIAALLACLSFVIGDPHEVLKIGIVLVFLVIGFGALLGYGSYRFGKVLFQISQEISPANRNLKNDMKAIWEEDEKNEKFD